MRYHEEPTPWDDGEYNTGYTTPPKSHRTFIALLLIAVIILIGLSTLLGVSNLRLFQQLNQQKAEPTICYSTAESVVKSEFVPIDVEQSANESIGFPALVAGLCSGAGVGLAVLYRSNPSLKQNLFITLLLWGLGAGCGMILALLGL